MKGLYASLCTLLSVGCVEALPFEIAEIQGAGSMWTIPPLEMYPREARHSEGLMVLAQKNYHKAGALSFTKKEYFLLQLAFPPHMHIPPYTY